MEDMSWTLITNKVKEHIGFHYLLTKATTVYFDLCGIEYIPQEVLSKIKDKPLTHNIFRIEDDGFIAYGFCCIAFIEYMIEVKTFLNYTNLFCTNDYKNNDKIIHTYFKEKCGKPWS